jgi:hypothetical protein
MAAFNVAYVVWLVPVYGYLGFRYPNTIGVLPAFGYCLGVLPAIWMPLALVRPSQFLHWIIYITVFLPSMLVLSFLHLQPDSAVGRLQMVLLCGLMIIGASYQFTRIRFPRISVSPTTFWALLGMTTVGLLARVIAVYWGQFHFVTWEKAYEIRYSGSDLAVTAGLKYPIYWLSIVFVPILMSLALLQKRLFLFIGATACSVLLFMTQGMKHILFSSVYIATIYLLMRRRSDVFGLRLVWAVALFLVCFCCYVVSFDAARSAPAMLLGANIVLRIFGNNGLLMGLYHNFFVTHQLTHYSSVTGVNWFIRYPYEHPLGIEISLASVGNTSLNNQNAGFWATDGLAAMGLPGIVVISILIALVFYALDCACSTHRATVPALFLSQYALILTNVSFFTSLVTGGLVIFFAIFYLMPRISLKEAKSCQRLRGGRGFFTKKGQSKKRSTIGYGLP